MKWATAILCVTLLAPLTLVDVPPLLDYPNHLARAVVLAFGATDPYLSRMYAPHWAIIPNLGTDLVLPPLLHMLPVHLAGRLVVGCIVLLPVIGTIAYSRATFGTRSAWPLASGLVAYNATLLLGFLNFVAAVGGALLLAAVWIAYRDRSARRVLALSIIGIAALFFCHLMGVVFFLALIAGHELKWIWLHRAEGAATLARIASLMPLAVVPLGLYLLSPLAPMATDIAFPSPAEKAWQLIFPFVNYLLPLDIITACMVGVFIFACFVAGRYRITSASAVALLLMAVLYLTAPSDFKGTFNFDLRFAVMLAFLLFGGILPTGLPRAVSNGAGTVFILLFIIRMTVVASAWHGYRHDVADLRRIIASVPPGSRVFLAAVSPQEAPEYWGSGPLARRLSTGMRADVHLPALLLIERRAYWPFLFDNPSQQPVETRSPYGELAARAAALIDHGALAVPGGIDLCGYDYLLLIDAGGEPDLAHLGAGRLTLLARTDFAALFRVERPNCL
jgi:hypothetical protein